MAVEVLNSSPTTTCNNNCEADITEKDNAGTPKKSPDAEDVRSRDIQNNNTDHSNKEHASGSRDWTDDSHVIYVKTDHESHDQWSVSNFTVIQHQDPDQSPSRTLGGVGIGSGGHPRSINGSEDSIISTDSEAAAHSKAFCWGLCCVQGCIWGILGMIYFFVFLPSGFLLILFGANKGLAWAVATGSVLLVMSTFGFPGICLCIKWYRRKQRDRRHEYRVERHNAVVKETYENPVPEDAEMGVIAAEEVTS